MKYSLLLIALIPLSAFCDETLSLRSAQEKLLEANPDLRIQKKELEKAQAQLSEARSGYWPSLDVSGSYQALTEKQHIDLVLPPPLPSVSRTLGDYDREEYGVDLSYPLFLGGGTRQQVLARRSSLDAQNERMRSLQNQLSLRLGGLYCAWHMAFASLKTQDSLVKFHETYLNRIDALVKGGKALPSRERMAQARLLSAKADFQTAQDFLDSISEAGGLMLGVSGKVAFILDTAGDSSRTLPESRPELAFLDKTSTSLEHQEKAILSQKFPTLVGTVGYRIANPGLNLGSNDYMNYGLLGVQLRWNLFDGFRNRSQRAEMDLQREEIRIERERQSEAFRQAENAAYKALQRLQKSKQAAQMLWDGSRLALSETQAQREQGMTSDLELLDAKVLEAKSALAVNQLLVQQYLLFWQYRLARGEDLKFPGEKYDVQNPQSPYLLLDSH